MMKYRFIALTGVMLLASCRAQHSSTLDEYTTGADFTAYEPNSDLFSEVASRVGCLQTRRWVLQPVKPLKTIVAELQTQKIPYDYLRQNLFSHANAPCGDETSKSTLDGIQKLYKIAESKGYGLSVFMIGGLGSHLTENGALALSRARWKDAMPAGTFRTERLECTPNSYASDDVCATNITGKIEALMQQEGSRPHMYLLWGYSKGGTVVTEILASSPAIRDRTLAVVTVGSPFGGGLPMKKIVPIFDQLATRYQNLPPQEKLFYSGLVLAGSGDLSNLDQSSTVAGIAKIFAPDQRETTLNGMKSVLPESRAAKLKNVVSKWNFSRSSNSPISGSRDIPFFHVAGTVDIASFKVVPDINITDSGQTKIEAGDFNSMQAAELAMVEELKRHPFSDMCIALEHAVIPKAYVPKGMKPELLSLLHMDHMSLGFSEKPSNGAPPGEAIVDAIMDVVSQRLGGVQ